jgi:hypothetical protein
MGPGGLPGRKEHPTICVRYGALKENQAMQNKYKIFLIAVDD